MRIPRRVFGKTLDFLRTRRHAYGLTFGSAAGRIVLADLAKFCRANETTLHSDPRISAALDGRREVWLRIQQHLNLSSEQLFALYNGVNATTEESE